MSQSIIRTKQLDARTRCTLIGTPEGAASAFALGQDDEKWKRNAIKGTEVYSQVAIRHQVEYHTLAAILEEYLGRSQSRRVYIIKAILKSYVRACAAEAGALARDQIANTVQELEVT